MIQPTLFEPDSRNENPKHFGNANIYYKQAGSILNITSGFMSEYDYSLNPYSGCAFGCTYCYAAFFARDNELKEQWGKWVNVKQNALSILKKYRSKPITGKTVYMSSVTDPYQPIEKKLELTRDILRELIEFHQPRLVVQTRSPLVTRDIDLFKKLNIVQVNMTITTDSESVRKAFEPSCPGNSARLSAIKEINDSGIQTCITMTPLLPVVNAINFAKQLLETGVQRFIVQPFHSTRGKFVAGTREEALKIIKDMNWTDDKYREVEKVLTSTLPNIGIGKEGFAPI